MFVGFTNAEPYYKNKNFRSTGEKNFYNGPESGVPSLNNYNLESKRGLTALEEGEALLNNLRNTDPRLMNQNGNRNNFYYDQPPAQYHAHENVNFQEIERLKLESEKDANEALLMAERLQQQEDKMKARKEKWKQKELLSIPNNTYPQPSNLEPTHPK